MNKGAVSRFLDVENRVVLDIIPAALMMRRQRCRGRSPQPSGEPNSPPLQRPKYLLHNRYRGCARSEWVKTARLLYRLSNPQTLTKPTEPAQALASVKMTPQESFRQQAPCALPPRPITFLELRRHAFERLDVVIVEDSRLPLVSYRLAFRAVMRMILPNCPG